MRIANWRSKEVFGALLDKAEQGANAVMDDVVKVVHSKYKQPLVKHAPPIYRKGRFGSARVTFIPKTGKNKGEVVDFYTDKRWTGRWPGQLQRTVRRVNKAGSGSVRVYLGNFKVYYASMVEKTGYTDRGGKFHPPLHILQGTFHAKKNTMLKAIANGGKI